MLYDPKWETKVDPRSMADFIGWLEKKNPRARYDYENCRGGCLIGQWLAHCGLEWFENHALFCSEAMYPLRLVSLEQPFTFGAALNRARMKSI